MENELISFGLFLKPLIGSQLSNDYLNTAVTAAIITASVALISALLSFQSSRKQLLDSLDSKSGWRKEIYDIASKKEIFLEDIYRLRSSLRLTIKTEKHREGHEQLNAHLSLMKQANDFDDVSDILILYCERLIECYSKPSLISSNIDEKNSHYIRAYCMYLLKYQWETLLSNWYKRWYWENFKEKEIIKKLSEELERIK